MPDGKLILDGDQLLPTGADDTLAQIVGRKLLAFLNKTYADKAFLSSTYVASPGVTAKTRVLVVGSSNAAGQGAATVGNSWVGRISTRLAATHEFVNIAVAGKDPATWITPGANGRSELDDAINTHRPHIVICAFATQNSGGPLPAYLTYVERAKAICDAHRVRYIGITPYASEYFSAAEKDNNLWLCEAIKSRDLPVLNFDSIWGYGATIPDSIDTGDGTHVNDWGHLEQSYQIPTDMLTLTSDCRPIALPGFGGVVIPSGTPDAGAEAVSVSAIPTGSWTIAFNVKVPNPGKGAVVILAFGGDNLDSRLRLPSTTTLDMTGSIVHSAQTVALGTEYHLALSFNALTRESKLYLNGAVVSTSTADAAHVWFSKFALGSRVTGGGVTNASTATGYTFRNLTVHATVLHPRDVARLATGRVPLASLQLAAPLTDGATRPAGGKFANTFGQETIVTTNYATA